MANSLKAKDETLNLMRERNILEYVEHLNCNGWQKLTSAGLQVEKKYYVVKLLVTNKHYVITNHVLC